MQQLALGCEIELLDPVQEARDVVVVEEVDGDVGWATPIPPSGASVPKVVARCSHSAWIRSVDWACWNTSRMAWEYSKSGEAGIHAHLPRTWAQHEITHLTHVRDADGHLRFQTLPRPTSEDVATVARWTHEGIARVLARPGRALDGFDDGVDELADEQPALASCYGASVSDRQLLGASPGEQTRKLVHPVRELDSPDEALAEVSGVNVHVGWAIDGRDRKRLERLCRYMARPPVCQERLEVTGAGQVVYRFKRAWRSGAHGVVLDPLDFIARLVALISRPPTAHVS